MSPALCMDKAGYPTNMHFEQAHRLASVHQAADTVLADPWTRLLDTSREPTFEGVEGGGQRGSAMNRAVSSVRAAVQRLATDRARQVRHRSPCTLTALLSPWYRAATANVVLRSHRYMRATELRCARRRYKHDLPMLLTIGLPWVIVRMRIVAEFRSTLSQQATATLGVGATASLGLGASLEPSAAAVESEVGASLLANAQGGTLREPTATMDLLAGLHNAAKVPIICACTFHWTLSYCVACACIWRLRT